MTPTAGTRATRPPRQPRNGHHPDCPYPSTPADHCGICRSLTIARTDEQTQPAHDPAAADRTRRGAAAARAALRKDTHA